MHASLVCLFLFLVYTYLHRSTPIQCMRVLCVCFRSPFIPTCTGQPRYNACEICVCFRSLFIPTCTGQPRYNACHKTQEWSSFHTVRYVKDCIIKGYSLCLPACLSACLSVLAHACTLFLTPFVLLVCVLCFSLFLVSVHFQAIVHGENCKHPVLSLCYDCQRTDRSSCHKIILNETVAAQ